jgi:hypothetical protein
MLSNIFGPERDEVKRDGRKLCSEQCHDVQSSPNIVNGDEVKEDEVGGVCGTYGGEEKSIQVFRGGKFRRKLPRGTARSK